MVRKSVRSRILALARKQGVIRAQDLAAAGLRREYLSRLARGGWLERRGRGLYVAVGARVTARHSLAEAARAVPGSVVCLISALRFHDLTTQAPSEVWIAIERRARWPTMRYPPLRVSRFSGAAFRSGVEEHVVEGVAIRVYSAAKTVADCFKFRRKVGLDVAMEALRDYARSRRSGVDELWRQAKVCRVANVMKPYMDSLL